MKSKYTRDQAGLLRMTRSRSMLPTTVLTVIATVIAFFVSMPTANAVTVDPMMPVYNDVVNGDFITTGNGVLNCSGSNCANLMGNGTKSQYNDNVSMQAVDVDGTSGNTTFDSSQATVTVPNGAKVVKAMLYWSGNTGAVSNGSTYNITNSCNGTQGSATPISGQAANAQGQAVQVKVGSGAYTSVSPETVASEAANQLAANNPQYYSANADITALFSGIATGSAQTVTVGNVWAMQGPNCAAGWTMNVVYDFGTAILNNPLSNARNVVLYDGYVRKFYGEKADAVQLTGFTAVATGARASLSLFEGDPYITGDYAEYAVGASTTYKQLPGATTTANVTATASGAGSGVNIGSSFADGAVAYGGQSQTTNEWMSTPAAPTGVQGSGFFNASVDAHAVPLPDVVVGSSLVNLQAGTGLNQSTGDSYLWNAAAISVPVAQVQINKTAADGTETQTVNQGETPTFKISVKNTGSSNITGVSATDPLAPGCNNTWSILAPGEEKIYTCNGPAATSAYTNSISVTAKDVNSSTINDTDTTDVKVLKPIIDAVKSGGTTTGPNADGSYTVTYDVSVSNTGAGYAIVGPLQDAPNFGTNLSVTGINWTATGGGASSGGITGAGPATLAGANTQIDPGVTMSWKVGVTFKYTDQNAASACAGPGTGLYNGISLSGAAETSTTNNSACVNPPARAAVFDATKTAGVVNGPAADGSYTVSYQVQVKNTGQVDGQYGALTDRPQFASNIAIDSATWTSSGPAVPPGGSAAGVGPYTLAPAATTLQAGGTHTYNVVVKFHYSDDNQATACNTAQPGTGLYNSVALPGTQDTVTTNNVACVPPPLPPNPTLSLTKTADPIKDVNGNGLQDAGDTITYHFTIKNTGLVNLTNLRLSDSKLGLAAASCTGTAITLAPGDSVDCTAKSYTITSTDVTAGKVHNDASAVGTPPTGSKTATGTAAKDMTISAGPKIDLTKKVGNVVDTNKNGKQDAGDTVTYSFTVTNTGNLAVNNVILNDSKLGMSNVSCGDVGVGATISCPSKSRVLTQTDIDGGKIDNTASTSGTATDGSTVTATGSASLTVPPSPSILLDKKAAAAIVDVNKNGVTDVGDQITYTFTVTNTGTVTLSPVTVADTKLGINNTCAGSLAPGATVECPTATHAITQTDLDSGSYDNAATATGTSPSGTNVLSTDNASSTVQGSSAITFDKTAGSVIDANNNGLRDAGDTITYTFSIKNTGSVSLTNLVVTDAKLGLNRVACGSGSLSPGDTRACASSTYTLTQTDVDSGAVNNTAYGYAKPPVGNEISGSDAASTSIGATPVLALTKTAGAVVDANGNNKTDPGDTIAYTFAVRNTGSVTLDQITVTDTKVSSSTIACGTGTLAPGASRACGVTVTYKLTQADIDAGKVDNTARAKGIAPSGDVAEGVSTATRAVTTTPSILLDKQTLASTTPATSPYQDVNGNGRVDIGDKITYRFVVTNTGNVTLSNTQLVDSKLAQNYTSCFSGPLAPGATKNCTDFTYTLTQADVNAGTVDNTATIHGLSPQNVDTTSTDAESNTIGAQVAMTLAKTASYNDVNGDGIRNVGDTVTYAFQVVNTGNVSLNAVTVTDAKLGLSARVCDANTTTPLEPGQSRDCTPVTYNLTQADINAGTIHNDASADGTGADPAATKANATSMADVPLAPRPGLTLDKSVTAQTGGLGSGSAVIDKDGSGTVTKGDQIVYTFVVTNTGNVSLAPVVITDAKAGYTGQLCDANDSSALDPGKSRTCAPKTYTLTQADVDSGTVNNTAVATGTNPRDGKTTTGNDSTSTTYAAAPKLVLDKRQSALSDPDGNGPDAGDTITYTFAVTNTGTVTLNPVTITDTKLGLNAVDCGIGALAPGTTPVVCTVSKTYTVTQADVNADRIVNNATAIGTPPTGAQVSGTDTETADLTIGRKPPTLAVDKQASAIADANANGKTDAGDRITFTYVISNPGTLSLTNPTVTDTRLGITNQACTPATPLEPGVSRECYQRVYTLTQADIDAGTYDNSATASAAPPTGARITSPVDTTSTPITQQRGLTLKKTVGSIVDANNDGRNSAGDTANYRFQVTNTGTVTVTGLSLTDTKLGINAETCGAGTLAPGASTYCYANGKTYTLTQADIDAARVVNNASVTGNPPSGAALTASDSVTLPVVQKASYTFQKTAGSVVDANGNGKQDAGDTIAYTFTVTNTGTVSLDPVTVTDQMLGMAGVACGAGALAPAATRTCTAPTYTLTQTDLDAGSVNNTATSAATAPDKTVIPGTSSASVALSPATSIKLTKTASAISDANNDGRQDAGDTITYTFSVQNTGTVTLNDVRLTDSKLGLTNVACGSGTLAAGATRACQQAIYTLTSDDANTGAVNNTATAAAKNQAGTIFTGIGQTSTPITEVATARLAKTAGAVTDTNADGIVGNAGDTITYSFAVTNTGNSALSTISVSDTTLGYTSACGSGAGQPALAAGATRACGSKTYTITQNDVNSGSVANTATVTATSVRGTATPPATDQTSTDLKATTGLQVTKTASALVDSNGDGLIGAGDTITYTFAVKNTGTQTLKNLLVTDTKIGLTNVACGTGDLAPGASRECGISQPYTVTVPDADAGKVTNNAAVNATRPDGTTLTGTGTTTTSIGSNPNMVFDKQVAGTDKGADGIWSVGDTIRYAFVVQNTGNVTLDPVTVSDGKLGLNAQGCGALAPGASKTCTTATYTVTQADIDSGSVTNNASGSGQPPTGAAITRPDSTVTALDATSALQLTKSASAVADVNANGRQDAGDTITYTFVVKNSGAKTLSNVTVTDAKLGLSNVACGTGSLAPGETRTCALGTRGVYTLTTADLDAAQVHNDATASSQAPDGATVGSNQSSVTVPLTQVSSLVMDKTAGQVMDLDGNGPDVGDTITYSFRITNTGTVSVNTLTYSDSTLGITNAACGVNPLAPGAYRDCTAKVYSLTQADIDAGAVNNTATAAGKDPKGATVTATPDTVSTATVGSPKITLVKTSTTPADANGNGRADAGELITYRFRVTNTGTTTLSGLSLSDQLLYGTTARSCDTTTLAPGASANCFTTAPTYAVTQDDIDAGRVINSATITAQDPQGNPVSAPSTDTRTLDQKPAVSLDKVASALVDTNNDGKQSAGDSITYTFSVTNTGNVSLEPVSVTDTKAGVSNAVCGSDALLPGQTRQCLVTTYVVNQADMNAGSVDNSATTTAQPPTGPAVTSTDTTTTPLVATTALDLVKSAGALADPDGNGPDAGDTITYTFTVTNTGTSTLKTVTITDAKLGLSNVACGTGNLEPGKSVTCNATTYATSQADFNTGRVVNTASATGAPVNGAAQTVSRTVTTPLPQTSTATFKKTASPVADLDGNGTDVGDQITYSFAVTNTGNTDLNPVTVNDPVVGVNGACGTTALAPGETRQCPAKTYTLTQADVDSGTKDNTATATFTRPDGTTFGQPSSTSTPLTRKSTLAMTKTAGAITDANSNGKVDAGDHVVYSFTVTNTGTTTLTGVTYADAKAGIAAGTACAATLAPGATAICPSVTYTLTQADVDAGTIVNNATAAATSPTGPVDAAATSTVPVTRVEAIGLDKVASQLNDTGSVADETDPGDSITYTFTVTNTGTATMQNVTIRDTRLAASPVACGTGPLLPGESRTCQVTTTNVYAITQADVDAGTVNNTATATATGPSGAAKSVSDSTSTPVHQTFGLTLDKEGTLVDVNGDGVIGVGDRIDYSLLGKNTGNTTLTDVRKNDPEIGINNALCYDPTTDAAKAGTEKAGVLAPGESRYCWPSGYTGDTSGTPKRTHVLTQADFDAAKYVNTATLTGTKPDGTKLVASDTFTQPLAQTTGLELDKVSSAPVDVDGNGIDAGDTIRYTFTVKNTGNTTLTDVVYSDSVLGLNGAACTATLTPGQTLPCPAKVYTLTQADVDAGAVNNHATATATPPAGLTPPSASDDVSRTFTPTDAISLTKTASAINDVDGNGPDAGDEITYTFVVKNSGTTNVNTVRVNDAKLGITSLACGTGTLAPGASVTCPTKTYVLTQADVDGSNVHNDATATALNPKGTQLTAPAAVDVPVTQRPVIALDKKSTTVKNAAGQDHPTPGATITYTFTVTNTGNVSLDNVKLTDSLLGFNRVDCGSGPLDPGASRDCQVTTYPLTQADIDRGSVDNTATAYGTSKAGTEVSSTDTNSVSVTQVKTLVLDKKGYYIDVDKNGIVNVGDRIDYELLGTNTGNVTLHDVRKNDPAININNALCWDPDAKQPDGTPSQEGVFQPGQSMDCWPAGYKGVDADGNPLNGGAPRRTHVLTQADIDSGHYDNTATLTGTLPDGTTKIVASDTVQQPLNRTASYTFKKTAGSIIDIDGNGPDVGDTITYSFSVTNTGNTTLAPITYTDAILGLNNATCVATLAPGQTQPCPTRTYTLTQKDIDSGSVNNTASMVATPPVGVTVTDQTSSTSTPTVGNSLISMTKTASAINDVDKNGPDAGDTVAYTFTVTNIGTTTLTNVTYQDTKLDIANQACGTGPLAPQESRTCAPKTYTLTQADVDAGLLRNAASTSGVDPTGKTVTAPASVDTIIPPNPTISLDKRDTPVADTVHDDINGPGDTITYTFHVKNTGNQALHGVTITDTKLGLNAAVCDTGTLAPGAEVDCVVTTYTLTQADVNKGSVDNDARVDALNPQDKAISAADTNSRAITQIQGLTLDKQGVYVDVNGNGKYDLGDRIDYLIIAKNTGNTTLTDVRKDDPAIGINNALCYDPANPAGAPGVLAPGETRTCYPAGYKADGTGTPLRNHVLTQADIDAGHYDNTATLVGTKPDGTKLNAADTVVMPLTRTASFTFDKTAGALQDTDGNGADVGDTITYTYTVTNTGNTTLASVNYTDTKTGINNVRCATNIAPGATVACPSKVVTLTQAQVNSGTYDNTATATAVPQAGMPAVPNQTDNTSTSIYGTGTLTLTKTATAVKDLDGNGTDVGDTVDYTLTVKNTGTVTLTNPTVSDPKIGMSNVACTPASLAPNATATCPVRTYTLTQADVDAGAVHNDATAVAKDPKNADVTGGAFADVTLPGTPAMTLDKQDSAIADTNGNGKRDVGDTITYTFVVTNKGNVTLNPVTITDNKLSLAAQQCGTAPLLPGASVTCLTTPYALTQQDIDSGSVDNDATAHGTTPSQGDIQATDRNSRPVPAAPALTLAKTAGTPVDVDSDGRIGAGDTIEYTFSVTNTGNVSLSPVNITDAKLGLTAAACGSSTTPLAPGVTRTGCIVRTYTITQADADAGKVVNNATATGTDPKGTVVTAPGTATRAWPLTSTISMDKVSGGVVDKNNNGKADPGDTIDYTFTVKNTGTTTLTAVTYSDTKLSITAAACGSGSLAPGAERICPAKTYTLTQADVDAGTVHNLASATGTDPTSTKVSGTDTVDTDVARTPAITLVKRLVRIDDDGDGIAGAGDRMVYGFTVTNSGNVTLNPVTYTDAQLGVNAAACGADPLTPGSTRECPQVTKVRTQADVDAGQFVNNATVTGTAPDASTVSSTSSVTVNTRAAITLDKTASQINDANGNGRTDVGDTIDYAFTVTNTGTVTLGTVKLSDDKLGYKESTCQGTALAPGASTSCLAKSYPLSQADIDAGVVNNTAAAYGIGQLNGSKTPTVTDSTSTPVAQDPTISLDKTASSIADTNSDGKVNAGDTVTYSFVVRNTGTTTLTNVTLSDPTLGINVPCVASQAGPLAPNASRTCTPYAMKLTQAQVDAGAVDNTATITGTDPKGNPVKATDDASTSVTAASAIKLVKTAAPVVDVNKNGKQDEGDTVTYTFTITNQGNTTLDPVTLTDPMVQLDHATCGSSSKLAPGASTTCTAVYALTLADLNNNGMVNNATATGVDPQGTTVTSSAQVAVTIAPVRSLAIDKQLVGEPTDTNGDGVVGAGDQLTYRFVVTNTGNLSLHAVQYSDSRIGLASTSCVSQVLDPGHTAECPSVTYTLTQADMDNPVTFADKTKAPGVINTATATALTPKDNRVTGSDTVEAKIAEDPEMEFDKTASGIVDTNNDGRQSAGDTITYTFVARNTGNVSLKLVGVTDAKLGMTNVQCTPNTIAPGQTSTCTRAYAMTQADVDAGTVDNNATVQAQTPLGKVSRTGDGTSSPVTQSPAISLVKRLVSVKDGSPSSPTTPDGIVGAGDTLTYGFRVTNTGTTTLNPVTIEDSLAGVPAPVTCKASDTSPLAPGASRECDQRSYTRTEADVTAGHVINNATAYGTPPAGDPVSATSSVDVPSRATITLDKEAGELNDVDGNGPDAGDQITYTFTVKNTGTVPLSVVRVTDKKVGFTDLACGSATLQPDEQVLCTTRTYTLTQADVDKHEVLNTATAYGVSAVSGEKTPTVSDSTVTPAEGAASLVLAKTSGGAVDVNKDGRIDAGETITYTFRVTNTGTETLTDIRLLDEKAGIYATAVDGSHTPVTCLATATGPLLPGQSRDCTAKVYVLTQADVDTSRVENTATAYGTNPDGKVFDDDSDAVVTAVPRQPAITLDKKITGFSDENGNGRVDAGELITYSFTVVNSGNVTLDPVLLNDPSLGLVDSYCAPEALAPGAKVDCAPQSVKVTQAQLDAGSVTNDATITGTAPNGAQVSDDDHTATGTEDFPELEQQSSMTLDKAHVSLDDDTSKTTDVDGSGTVNAGDTLTFTFAVTNTGNTSLTDLTVSDPTIQPATVSCPQTNPDTGEVTPKTTLAPGETANCTADYTLTQNDIDRGRVENSATATAHDPKGGDVTASDTDVAKLSLRASMTLDKQAGAITDVNGDGEQDAGDTVAYTFKVTNTGNVPLDHLVIDDPKIPAGITSCTHVTTDGTAGTAHDLTTEPFEPLESVLCTATYTLTADDRTAGTVDNTATLTGQVVGGKMLPPEAVTDGTSTPLRPIESFTMKKTSKLADTNGNGTADLGEVITYAFTVANTGTVDLAKVGITDAKLWSGPKECLAEPLAPGATVTCLSTPYTVQASDLGYGTIDNSAQAIAYHADGTTLGSPAKSAVSDKVAAPAAKPVVTKPGTTTGTGTGTGTGLPGGVWNTNTNSTVVVGDHGLRPWIVGKDGRPIDPVTGRPLAYTGANVASVLLSGLALLVLGGLIVLMTRRRDEDEDGTEQA